MEKEGEEIWISFQGRAFLQWRVANGRIGPIYG